MPFAQASNDWWAQGWQKDGDFAVLASEEEDEDEDKTIMGHRMVHNSVATLFEGCHNTSENGSTRQCLQSLLLNAP